MSQASALRVLLSDSGKRIVKALLAPFAFGKTFTAVLTVVSMALDSLERKQVALQKDTSKALGRISEESLGNHEFQSISSITGLLTGRYQVLSPRPLLLSPPPPVTRSVPSLLLPVAVQSLLFAVLQQNLLLPLTVSRPRLQLPLTEKERWST